MTVQGVDVSICQPRLPWGNLREQGVRFAWVKATGAQRTPIPAIYDDQRFLAHVTDAKQELEIVGGYHFFSPALDVREQALRFCHRVAAHGFRLPPMLDLEASHGVEPRRIAAAATEWCAHVEEALRQRVVVYAFPSFVLSIPEDALVELAKRDLVISHFKVHPVSGKMLVLDAPTVPRPWTRWAVWQLAGNLGPSDQSVETEGRRAYRFAGVPFDVDRDAFQGTEDDLAAWAGSHDLAHAPTEPAPAPSHADEPLGGATPDAAATPLRAEPADPIPITLRSEQASGHEEDT